MFGKKKKEKEMTKKYTWTELLTLDAYHQPKEKQEETMRSALIVVLREDNKFHRGIKNGID